MTITFITIIGLRSIVSLLIYNKRLGRVEVNTMNCEYP